ncbi:hypothetical protein PR003_g12558 [Phytophthora rubi]|uniref:Uncharacterized protein n=1 Tax=Phytophthora rubi TaxID=129364 RepID=A0A6A3MIT9_9STRA|nr:hypothetical protein PR002_g12170 [Phytophthora rubi]KAE9028093.1 hypothetical protein PR001_g11813 [Phytophthora rubi]KAE9336337.1 hypothetical protein PR003_g12558 [Phytophthora rubi]
MLVCEGYGVVQLYVLEYLSGIKFLFHGGGEAIGVARLRGGVQASPRSSPLGRSLVTRRQRTKAHPRA